MWTFDSIVFASEPKLRSARTGSSWSAIALRKQRWRHPRVVARVLARADVRERLAAVEAVRAAGDDVDRRLRLAPRRARHLVAEPLLDEDLDPAERVDEVGEADEVHERVVVDADPEQRRHRLLQVARALSPPPERP